MSSNNPPKIANPFPESPASVNMGARSDLNADPHALLDEARQYTDQRIATHVHGADAQAVGLNIGISGLFEVVSAPPTNVPKSPFDQVKIYINSTTYRLYVYDYTNTTWHYVALT